MKDQINLPTNSVWGFLFLVFIFRLAYIYLAPMQLVPDEAYYWDWSRRLDIGYYSKPPMVAWLNFISTYLFGINEVAVRFFAALLGTASVGGVYLLAKEMFDENVAFFAAAMALLTPANCALSFLMTIDPPLVFFGTFSLYFLWKAISTEDDIGYFTLSGICTGLGILSKQMMILYLVLVPIFFFINKKIRHKLTSLGFVIYLFISLFALALPIYWNYKHGWVTLQENLHHISSNPSLIKTLQSFFEYIGGQLLIITPIFGFLIYYSLFKNVSQIKNLDLRYKFLFILGGVPLILFILGSLKQRINANWPALFYPPAIVFAAGYIFEYKKEFKKILNIGLIVAYVFVFLTYVTPFIFSINTISGSKIDPTTRGKGWKELANKFEKIYLQYPQKDTFILSERRDIISELAFYLKDHPFIYKWDRSKDVVQDQYEVWGGPNDTFIGKDSIMIFKRNTDIRKLYSFFHSINKIQDIEINVGKNKFRNYTVYLGKTFKGFYQ